MTVNDDVQALSADIWAWRDRTAFRSADDIPRIPHAADWLPVLTEESVVERRAVAATFLERWKSIDPAGAPVPVQVDHRLLGSVLARSTWELDILRTWERDALFLAGQALGPYFDLLLQPPPFSAAREAGLVRVLRAIPDQLAVARDNLARAGVAPLAAVAADALATIEADLTASVEALAVHVAPDTVVALGEAVSVAGPALAEFASWLRLEGPRMPGVTPVGRESFVWYLRHVALVAREPEELVAIAKHEYDRAVLGEALARGRFATMPPADIAATATDQVERQIADEAAVRAFYEDRDLLSQPPTFGRYLTAPMPAYLEPLRWLGVTDDLTDEHRLRDDGVSYTPAPRPDLPYFPAANARDPRLGIIHEGAHYQQLVRSWSHENPVRRHYYDSVAGEGIAHYNEELLLQAGLFDDAPRSPEVVHNFMRLRALRVIVDINLATGEFGLEDGIATFVENVPMDRETASEETATYTGSPGLAMSYLVGKIHITSMVADALAGGMSLREVHDFVWKNGNVPLSLQRWELLGDRSEVDRLNAPGQR